MANLKNADYLALKSIYELGDEVQMHIADKLSKKSALKFNKSVMALMSKMPEHLEEQRRKKEEEERHVDLNNNNLEVLEENEYPGKKIQYHKLIKSFIKNC